MSCQNVTLYKYMDCRYVAECIEKHRLYLNDGSSFNDPFELMVTNSITKSMERMEGLHILSLTTGFRKKLMWSHYADSHEGVCLTVKVPKHIVYPIVYSRKRVYSDSCLDDIIMNGIRTSKRLSGKNFSSLSNNKKIAYIKDEKWKYEKECRVVFDVTDECGLIFDDDKWFMSVKISNIYLGVRFFNNKKEICKSILDACKQYNVTVKEMVMSDRKYELKVKPYDPLSK